MPGAWGGILVQAIWRVGTRSPGYGTGQASDDDARWGDVVPSRAAVGMDVVG